MGQMGFFDIANRYAGLDAKPALGLDPGDTDDAVHGGQQPALFNAHVACPRA